MLFTLPEKKQIGNSPRLISLFCPTPPQEKDSFSSFQVISYKLGEGWTSGKSSGRCQARKETRFFAMFIQCKKWHLSSDIGGDLCDQHEQCHSVTCVKNCCNSVDRGKRIIIQQRRGWIFFLSEKHYSEETMHTGFMLFHFLQSLKTQEHPIRD